MCIFVTIGIYALEVAGLSFHVYGKDWEAFVSTLDGVFTQPVTFAYADVTALNTIPQISLKSDLLSGSMY